MLFKLFKPSITELAPLIEEALKSGHSAKLTVTGYSMYPMLRSGADDVVLSPCDTIKKYDLVLFKRTNGEYILHRVIGIKGNTLSIAGDNETKKETPVAKDAVIGKMTSFVRSGKEYSADALWYRFYSRIWYYLFPLRHILARIYYCGGKIYRKFKR